MGNKTKRITFEEVLSEKEYIHAEILSSIPSEVITKAIDDKFYEVSIIINGIEVEPKFFNKIMTNLEHYIDKEAKKLVAEKLYDAEQEVDKLNEAIREAKANIIDKFDLPSEDY